MVQDVMSQLEKVGDMPRVPRFNKKETSLIAALKQKIKSLETDLVACKQENESLRKNVKLTKKREIETETQIFQEECRRLRLMLKDIISERHAGNPAEYEKMEEKVLEQKVIINEMNNKNQELESNIKAKNRERTSI